MSRNVEVPRSARLLIAGVVAAGLAITVSQLPVAARWDAPQVAAWAGLVAAGALLEQFLLPLRHRSERQFFSLTDSLWVMGLLVARPSVVILAAAGAILIGQGARRVAPYKVAFNVAQYVVAIAAAEAVYRALHQGGMDLRSLRGSVLAMVVYLVMNAGAVALVISLVVGRPFLPVLTRPLPFTVLQWGGNVVVGMVGAALWTVHPASLPLLLLPLAVAYLTYRWRLRGIQERTRLSLA